MKFFICLFFVCLLVGINAQTQGQGVGLAAAQGQGQGFGQGRGRDQAGLFGMGQTGNLFAASGMLGNMFMKF